MLILNMFQGGHDDLVFPIGRGRTPCLTVRRVEVNRYAWRLQAKPIGAEDSAYLIIMGGSVARGTEAHRGRGVVGVNLDNLKLVLGDAFNGQGKMLAAFAHVENAAGTAEAKSLAYLLHGFTPDSTQHDPVDAAFVGQLTLERPFRGSTRDAVFAAIRGRLYQPVIDVRPEVSQELSEIVDRAFSEDVADRFADAADFAIALDP